MPMPRRRLVDPSVTRWYHCFSKCVRNAFLLTEQGGTNRKEWIHQRIQVLCELFSIAVAGFAILDNHLHLVVRLDPDAAHAWSNEEVARRWARLFPPRVGRRKRVVDLDEWVREQARNAEWIAERRARLQSLSWFMKCLNEPLARLANQEDGCDGAFFARRFKSIALLDLAAVLEACAYVDLNPFAAGLVLLPELALHTSLRERVIHAWPAMTPEDLLAALRGVVPADLPGGDAEQTHWLCPMDDRRHLGGSREGILDGFSLPKYLLLLDAAARRPREGKAQLQANVAPIFDRLGMTVDTWIDGLTHLKNKLSARRWTGRARAGTREALNAAARRLGVRHLVNLGGRSCLAPSAGTEPTLSS